MPDHLLHKIIYVLFSGFTEFLPVSARAHQMLYELLTGIQMADSMVTVSIRLGTLAAVMLSCKNRIRRLVRQNRLERVSRRRDRHLDRMTLLDTQVLKTATIPILISVLLYKRAVEWVNGVALLSLMLFLNGLLLFVPSVMAQGNKDGRNLSRLDSVSMGIGGALAVIPGFSRMGGIISAGLVRGTDRDHVLDLALMLSIPALLGSLVFDIYAVIAAKMVLTALGSLIYIFMAALAFGTAYLSIMIMRYLTMKAGSTSFSYYSWGMSLFSFILYLMI